MNAQFRMIKIIGTKLAQCEAVLKQRRPGNIDSNDDGIFSSQQLGFLKLFYIFSIRTLLKCKLRHRMESALS